MFARFAIAVILAIAASGSPRAGPAGTVVEYRGGAWFDGSGFVRRPTWTNGDCFAARRPDRVDQVIDLDGGFVVPPYGEGHNHWLEPKLVDAYVQMHLRDGIFYVKDLDTSPAFHDAMRPALGGPGSVDYVSAHQGFTGPGGHPLELVDLLLQLGVAPPAWRETHGEGDVLFVVASPGDVERAWPRLVAGHPDFVKVFLIHSDEYAARRDNPKRTPKERGIDPVLVPGIVARAHAAGLRVSAHIENAHDFHVAMAAGVDDIAHLPFVEAADLEGYRLAEADVRTAGARSATVATTLDWASDAAPTDPRIGVLRDNLARLRRAGARILIGTDRFRQTARAEVELIARLGVMTNRELLKAWSEETPRAIFPSRSIGRLVDGYEASFLVLKRDPLTDPANLHSISRRVKLGKPVVVREDAIRFPPL